jgi:hypothetical protein
MVRKPHVIRRLPIIKWLILRLDHNASSVRQRNLTTCDMFKTVWKLKSCVWLLLLAWKR